MQAIRFTYFVQQEEVDESEKSESSVGDALHDNHFSRPIAYRNIRLSCVTLNSTIYWQDH